jgi:nicotinate-nucleotide pyrophosphorylase (carboxylating)
VSCRERSDDLLPPFSPFLAVFEEVGCRVEWQAEEGQYIEVEPGGKVVVAVVTGRARHILIGERTALNIITRASGVATQVGLRGTPTEITLKIPGVTDRT